MEKYLGGLPITGKSESFRDLGIRNPAGPVAETVRLGLDDKAQVRLVYRGDFEWSAENTVQLDALAELLEFQLLEKLREEAGGVYSVSTQGVYAQYPTPRYLLRIAFGCAPAQLGEAYCENPGNHRRPAAQRRPAPRPGQDATPE